MVQELFTPVSDPRPDVTLEQAQVEALSNPDSVWNQAESPAAEAIVTLNKRTLPAFDILDGPFQEIKRTPENGDIVKKWDNGSYTVCVYEGNTSSRCDLITPAWSVSDEQVAKWEAKKASKLDAQVR